MEKSYMVEFEFIEDGLIRKTTWLGPSTSSDAAEKKARDWFGFDKDGIEVVSAKVEELN